MVPLINSVTGQQDLDPATGLPMWLVVGDPTGMVVVGVACVLPPVAAPPCIDITSMMSLLDANTGEQARDQSTGLQMWLIVGDDSGMVLLGTACEGPVLVPLGLPPTGDGTAPTLDGTPSSPRRTSRGPR